MHEFPFEGLDLEPTPVQADLIAKFKSLVADTDLPEPDVIQPRPTNPEAIEIFWESAKLCVVIESDDELEAMFNQPPVERARLRF